jgi:hypothetical protein
MAPGAFERVLKEDYTVPHDPNAVEVWMQKMGTKFVTIWFWDRRTQTFRDENHVDDDETLLETISQTFDRMRWRQAIWDHGGGWTSLDNRTGDSKCWPSREAAEMFVIHNER